MGRVTIDSQGLPPVSFSRAPDAEDLGHPNKPAARVSTLAAAKPGGNELESNRPRTLHSAPKTALKTRGHAFSGVETVPFRVDKTSCPA